MIFNIQKIQSKIEDVDDPSLQLVLQNVFDVMLSSDNIKHFAYSLVDFGFPKLGFSIIPEDVLKHSLRVKIVNRSKVLCTYWQDNGKLFKDKDCSLSKKQRKYVEPFLSCILLKCYEKLVEWSRSDKRISEAYLWFQLIDNWFKSNMSCMSYDCNITVVKRQKFKIDRKDVVYFKKFLKSNLTHCKL